MIDEEITLALVCDGEGCKKCRGRCTNTYPGPGCRLVIGGVNATREVAERTLRAEAQSKGWLVGPGWDCCPDCRLRMTKGSAA